MCKTCSELTMDADRVKIMLETKGIWKGWKISASQIMGKESWKIWNLRWQVRNRKRIKVDTQGILYYGDLLIVC